MQFNPAIPNQQQNQAEISSQSQSNISGNLQNQSELVDQLVRDFGQLQSKIDVIQQRLKTEYTTVKTQRQQLEQARQQIVGAVDSYDKTLAAKQRLEIQGAPQQTIEALNGRLEELKVFVDMEEQVDAALKSQRARQDRHSEDVQKIMLFQEQVDQKVGMLRLYQQQQKSLTNDEVLSISLPSLPQLNITQ